MNLMKLVKLIHSNKKRFHPAQGWVHQAKRFIVFTQLRAGFIKRSDSPHQGITLLLVILVLGSLLSISLGIFSVVLAEIRLSGELNDSFRALYVSDRGMEKLLYLDRVANAICPPFDESTGTFPPCPPYVGGLSFPMTVGPLANGGCMNLNISRASNQVTVSSVGQQNCAVNELTVKRALFARYTKDTPSGFPTPVGFWKFDEGSGPSAEDSSGNDNTGTLVNGPVWDAGKQGSALNLDGLNDYVSVADTNSLDFSGAMTLTAWIYQRSAIASGYRIIDKETAGIGNGYLFDTFDSATGRKLRLCGAACAFANTLYSLNTWHHVAVTVSGTTATFYLDGVLDGSGAVGNIVTNALDLRIGAPHVGCGGGCGLTEYFNGIIDEVRVYNTALTQPQIQTVMSSP